MDQPKVSVLQKIRALTVEEKIINVAYLVSLVSLFLPWLSGNSSTGSGLVYNAFDYYTGFIGLTIFLCTAFCLAITVTTVCCHKKLIRQTAQAYVRYHLTALSFVLALAVLTVYTKLTWEVARLDIRFGIYMCLISSIVSSVYTYITWHTQNSSAIVIVDTEQLNHITEEIGSTHIKKNPFIPAEPAAIDHKPFGNKLTK